VVLTLSALLYFTHGVGWPLFALPLLVPELSMLGYQTGPRIGAAAYNVFHTYTLPAVVGALGPLEGVRRHDGRGPDLVRPYWDRSPDRLWTEASLRLKARSPRIDDTPTGSQGRVARPSRR
jgi:hypothetical protein